MQPVRKLAVSGCFLILWMALSIPVTAEVLSETAGHNSVLCEGGSDTVVSVPFHLPPSFSSAVTGSPVVSATEATLSFQSERTLGEAELTDSPHYLKFISGARTGRIYPVDSHAESSITVDPGEDDFSGVAEDDLFQVIPYWTLSRLFPKDTQSAIHVSSGKLAPARKSRILFFDEVSQGFGLAPDQVYFLTTQGWFRSDRGFPAADDAIIPPGKAFVIRHSTADAQTFFQPHSFVSGNAHTTPLKTRAGGRQDNSAALVRPVPVKLSDLDFGSTFSSSASTSAGNRADELLLYDNATIGFNKPPATIYFKVGNQWRRDDGSSFPVADNDPVPPSAGILIRKAGNASGTIFHWVNSAPY